MCKGENCPLKSKCFRYTAIPNLERQSYFLVSPVEDNICEYFLSNKEQKRKNAKVKKSKD